MVISDLKFQTQLILGFWGHETFGSIRQAVQKANWIVDVGAGSGTLCIIAAQLKRVTQIIAIEPDQAMVRRLQASIDHNEVVYNDIFIWPN